MKKSKIKTGDLYKFTCSDIQKEYFGLIIDKLQTDDKKHTIYVIYNINNNQQEGHLLDNKSWHYKIRKII